MSYIVEYHEPTPMERFPDKPWHVYLSHRGYMMLEFKAATSAEADQWVADRILEEEDE